MPLALPDAMHRTQVNGVDIRYLRAGSGTPVLLLHTLRTQLDMFGPLLEQLDTARVEVIAADLPGHGESGAPPVRYTAGYFTDMAEALLEACTSAGITAEISTDILKTIWQKFVFLVGMSSTTTLTRMRVGKFRNNEPARNLLLSIMREVAAVGRKKGANLDADFADKQISFIDQLPETMTTSMHHDLQAGKPLEVRWLSGGVVDLGAQVGVPTPMNRAVRDILLLHAEGQQGTEC